VTAIAIIPQENGELKKQDSLSKYAYSLLLLEYNPDGGI
jgi:hypothetical protein